MSDYYGGENQHSGWGEGVTFGVQRVILLAVAVFIVQLLLDIPFGDTFVQGAPAGDLILEWLAFSPGKFLDGYVWMPLTYIFLHAGLSHLFFNMLSLFIFGPAVERVLGTRQFVIFFLLCGILGVFANYISIYFLSGHPNIAVMGASGSVMGVLIAAAIVEPHRRVFIFPIPIPLTTRAIAIVLIGLNIMTALGGGSTTSVATHFGGMAVGFVFIKYRPLVTRWRLRRRVRKGPGPSTEDQEELGKVIDNIFKFQNRNRH